MLGQIIAVTMTVASLAPMESAYRDYLGYKTVDQGKVSSDAAKTWGASKVSGKDYLMMLPESGAPHYLRFVVSAPYPDSHAMRMHGWNATELLVQDPDAMAAKLRTSPFKIVGEPRGLSPESKTKAMQVIGPNNELLYLTNPAGENNKANTAVDRYFIVINGGADLTKLSTFFSENMGTKVTPPMEFRLSVLNKHFGFDPEMKHKIAVARLNGGPFSIELDQYPKEAKPLVGRADDLPPGVSMVTFEVENLDAVKEPFIQKPAILQGKPYDGRRVGVIKGPSGELFELVETGKK